MDNVPTPAPIMTGANMAAAGGQPKRRTSSAYVPSPQNGDGDEESEVNVYELLNEEQVAEVRPHCARSWQPLCVHDEDFTR